MYLMQPDQETSPARRHVLWPTDFSASARRAFPPALALSEYMGAQLHLVHVVQPADAPANRARQAVKEKEARIKLEQFRMAYRYGLPSRQAPDVVLNVLHAPSPSQAIAEYAAARAIDLIVMGTRGGAAFSESRLGSTAAEVLSQAPCSVMVVPASQQATGLPRTILALTYDAPSLDGRSSEGRRSPSIPFVALLNAGRCETPAYDGAGWEKAGPAQAAGSAPIVECVSLPDAGEPVESLLAALAERETDLVVVPTAEHGRGRVSVESVKQMAEHALCSVLAAKDAYTPLVTAYP